jgi:hypothetical protein
VIRAGTWFSNHSLEWAPPRSFGAEANDCFMVRRPYGATESKIMSPKCMSFLPKTGRLGINHRTAMRPRGGCVVPAPRSSDNIACPAAEVAVDSDRRQSWNGSPGGNPDASESTARPRSPNGRPSDCHPEAAVIIPPRATAVPKEKKAATQRDRHIAEVEKHGRIGWQRRSGYNSRSLVEAGMYRYKTIVGRRFHARTLPNQRTEAKSAATCSTG